MISGYDCFVIKDGMSDEKIAKGLEKCQSYIDDRAYPKKTPEQIEIEYKIGQSIKNKNNRDDDVVITKVSF